LQKRPIISSILLIVATPYRYLEGLQLTIYVELFVCMNVYILILASTYSQYLHSHVYTIQYVAGHAQTHTCTHPHTQTHTHAHTHTHTHINALQYRHSHIYKCVANMFTERSRQRVCVHLNMRQNKCVCLLIHAPKHIHNPLHMFICTNTFT